MSLLNKNSNKVLIQGLGRDGSFQAERCIEFGTNIVSGVHPTKAGEKFKQDIPIFGSVNEAVSETSPDIGLIFVPAPFAADAIIEQIDANISVIVCVTEGIPIADMVKVNEYLKGKMTRLIGPNCPGYLIPEKKLKVGIIPGSIVKPGNVGVVSRSGTLTYEAIVQLTKLGIGQSACVGIGGDPINGTSFVDVIDMFEEDDNTEAIVMIGEIGGTKEQEAAERIKNSVSKPVVASIVGQTAPEGRRMGHAGAVITGKSALASEKINSLKDAGVVIADSPTEIGQKVKELLKIK
ncbi:MAG: succinate--CoA ligase subunit alpha [SAR202 cluster bacterium]|nr:succinate--CoA ligase subunit alpha [SAR202 cluster bacterium]|tara:strand:+ start:297 stop:1175 length:879 start_codon:yes stop_codon:yes gene_type:complete